ncbi:MAG TPA: M20 family metallopeptidase [Mycobacteriales bacterium]|nr:M20 family metallopeptidase [Mycobacteriales bacterium]
MSNDLTHAARELTPHVVALRRDIHRHPERGLQLPHTQQAVLTALDGLGLAVRTGRAVSSVVATLDGARPGRTILLRGDMDALPLTEDTGLDFASRIDGVMHACGHDTHVAMLAGAARLLAARRAEFAGRIVFMFQPGEEGFHGARYMLEEGLLDADGAEPVSAAFALHITSQFPAGTINLRGGPQMASSDTLRITVRGSGGHASAPHEARDPIPVACEITQALQTMVTRRVSVFDPAVVTVARISAGTTSNIIPEVAEIEGTMRALSERTRASVRAHVAQVAEGIAAAHGLSASVDIESGYPVTVNDPGFAEFATSVAVGLLGADRVTTMPDPVMGAEDFSYVLARVPGAMAFLGGCPPDLDPAQAPANHSNRVVFDEQAMATGVATYASVALRHLAGR